MTRKKPVDKIQEGLGEALDCIKGNKAGATVQNYLIGNEAGKAVYVADELEDLGGLEEDKMMTNSAIGSSLDDLLQEDGILPEVAA